MSLDLNGISAKAYGGELRRGAETRSRDTELRQWLQDVAGKRRRKEGRAGDRLDEEFRGGKG